MAERNAEVHEVVNLFSVMSLEDNVNEDENSEPVGQTSLTDSNQISTTVDTMEIDTEESARAAAPLHSEGFFDTSQLSLDCHFTHRAGGRKARLSVVVRPDAMASLANNYKEALQAWVSLLRMTTFPCTIASSDARFLMAFRALDNAIAGSHVSYMFARFAYFRLIQLFNFLKTVLQSERRRGQLRRGRGYGNASAALDIYLSAQQLPFTVQKRELIERMRTGRRWKKLAGPSPFFLMIYSEAAKAVVYVFTHRLLTLR